MFHPKKLVAILGLSTFLLTPFAPPVHIGGADSAFAGQGNGNGGGNGNGNGGGNGGGNAGGNGGGNGGGNANAAANTASDGTTTRETRLASTEESATHGSVARSLGNMNGALHANIHAVLAHIRNGNTNGPVGLVAGIVGADADLTAAIATAADLAALEAEWVAYEAGQAAALQGTSYTSAQQYIDTGKAYSDWLATDQSTPAPTAPDGSAYVPVAAIDSYIAAAPTDPRPTAQELADAQTAITDAQAAVTDAEAAVLAKWNKNPDGDTASISPEEQALLDSLRARFSPEDLAAIAAAAAG